MTKKHDLERELRDAGWKRLRGRGGSHDIFSRGGRIIAVPRHAEINELTAQRIRREAQPYMRTIEGRGETK